MKTTMYSPVESELFLEESQAPDFEPGSITMVLLMTSDGEKEWIPMTIQGISLSQLSGPDLNKMNANLSLHAGHPEAP